MILPASLAEHDRGHLLGAQVSALEVDVDRAVPLVLGRLQHRLGEHDAGVVDQDVDAPEVVDGGADEIFDVSGRRDVGAHRERVAARLLDRIDHRLRFALSAHPVDDHLGALGGETLRDRLADPARRARHDGDLAFQSLVAHPHLLYCEAPRADTGQQSTSSPPRLAQTWSCRLKVVRICPGMKST